MFHSRRSILDLRFLVEYACILVSIGLFFPLLFFVVTMPNWSCSVIIFFFVASDYLDHFDYSMNLLRYIPNMLTVPHYVLLSSGSLYALLSSVLDLPIFRVSSLFKNTSPRRLTVLSKSLIIPFYFFPPFYSSYI